MPLRADDPAQLMRGLFGTPRLDPVAFAATDVCEAAACAVRLADEAAWAAPDGKTYMLLVTATEPPKASHATPALLGIALLRKDPDGWTLKAGSPAVDKVGAYGVAPDVSTTIAGVFGRGVVLTSSYTGQGVVETSWLLYLPVDGRFAKILQIQVGQDSSGICAPGDAPCWRIADPRNTRAPDFRSRVKASPSEDGGLDVKQAVLAGSPESRVTATRLWHIDTSGVAHEHAPGEAIKGDAAARDVGR